MDVFEWKSRSVFPAAHGLGCCAVVQALGEECLLLVLCPFDARALAVDAEWLKIQPRAPFKLCPLNAVSQAPTPSYKETVTQGNWCQ